MAGLGYKDFTAGAVLTAAQVDGYLMEQAVMNFAGTAARGSALSSVQAAGMMAHVGGGTVTVYDGSAWQQVYPNTPGLVYVAGTAFSAVSSVSVNNCFSATYENYVYIGHVACTTQAQVGLRLRVSGTDNSTAGNYLWGGAYTRWVTSATVAGEHSSTTATSFPLTDADGNFSFFEGKLFSPFASRLTGFNNVQAYNQGGSLNDGYWEAFAGSMTVTTSYTGFTIFPASGNISGSISIYGLRNS